MAQFTDIDGNPVLVEPGALLVVRSVRPNHHGIKSTLTLVNGDRIEVREDPQEIAAKLWPVDRRVGLTNQLITFLKEGFTYEASVVRDLVAELEQL